MERDVQGGTVVGFVEVKEEKPEVKEVKAEKPKKKK